MQAFGSLIGSVGGIDASPGAVTKAIKEGASIGICPGQCSYHILLFDEDISLFNVHICMSPPYSHCSLMHVFPNPVLFSLAFSVCFGNRGHCRNVSRLPACRLLAE